MKAPIHFPDKSNYPNFLLVFSVFIAFIALYCLSLLAIIAIHSISAVLWSTRNRKALKICQKKLLNFPATSAHKLNKKLWQTLTNFYIFSFNVWLQFSIEFLQQNQFSDSQCNRNDTNSIYN